MNYVLIKHKVADFDPWKSAYDEHEGTRQTMGLKEVHLLRERGNPNLVVLLFHAADPERATAFIQSEDLKSIMKKAGVMGMPEILFLND